LGELHISFDTPADYGMHAEAVGALRAVIKDTKELETALTEAEKVQGDNMHSCFHQRLESSIYKN
jgi:thiamine pyrophosphate-dependent acetolactate synthase large subunit-like protein